jgi:hypothetical protein
MKPFRKLRDARARRREGQRNRLEEATHRARLEARTLIRERRPGTREEKIRAAVRKRAERMERFERRVRSGRQATGRRVRPAVDVGHRGVSRIAPFVSRGLMTAVRIPVAAVATLLDFTLESARSARRRLGPVLAGLGELIQRHVTPANTLMAVGLGFAVALAVSQFVDYKGIAVGEPLYQGDAANVAPVPLTEVKQTGSAHYYALLPLALAAMVMIVLTRRGRWRFGRLVGLIGAIGIAVTLLIDRPEALDAGPLADAYAGSEAKLLDGYYAQLVASIGLLLSGPLLGAQVRRDAGTDRGERRRDREQRRLRGKHKFVGSTHRREASV